MDADDRLKWLFARAFEESLPDDDCPPPEQLLDAVHERLPEDERLRVIDHLADCPLCAEAWRIARRAEGGER